MRSNESTPLLSSTELVCVGVYYVAMATSRDRGGGGAGETLILFGFTHKGLAFEVPTDNIHHTIKPGFRIRRFFVFDGYLHGNTRNKQKIK